MKRGAVAAAAIVAGLAGCAAQGAGAGASEGAGAPPPAIAAVHAHKCNKCHAAPKPGTRARGYLEEVFVRHRKRVRLSEDQWREMVAYLAAPDGQGTAP
jgi:Cu/Zn superoxide dismutase